MTASIPVNLLEGWIAEMQSILKGEARTGETRTDLVLNKGIRHGLDQVQHKITTWLTHQENVQALKRSGEKFLITKDIDLSDGRYRKLEWYEGDLFLTLAWRHGRNEETGELMLELQRVQDLSKTYLVYQGGSSFDELAGLARESGMEAVKNQENQGEWVAKTYT